MNKTITYAALILAGAVAGAAVYAILSGSRESPQVTAEAQKTPLYWVWT
jgi:hypothetical protein